MPATTLAVAGVRASSGSTLRCTRRETGGRCRLICKRRRCGRDGAMAGGEGFSGKVVGLARVRKQEKDEKGEMR